MLFPCLLSLQSILTALSVTTASQLGVVPSVVCTHQVDLTEIVGLNEHDLPSPECVHQELSIDGNNGMCFVAFTAFLIRKQVYIVAFMNRQGHLNNTQHGFRSGRSCLFLMTLCTCLAVLTTVDMIYLDFSKAIDKVDHGVLLHKLIDLGIPGKLGIWFFQF